jgi:hypothetical protein
MNEATTILTRAARLIPEKPVPLPAWRGPYLKDSFHGAIQMAAENSSTHAWLLREYQDIAARARAAMDKTGFADARIGSALVPLVDVMQEVQTVLQVTLRQAYEFTERMFVANESVLYIDDEDTGLWRLIAGVDSHGRGGMGYWFTELFNSLSAAYWGEDKLSEWRLLRITPSAHDLIVGAAKSVLMAKTEPVQVASPPAKLESPKWPWGAHDTKLLSHLAAAAEKWWSNYDPNDNTTAHTNEEVSGWLQERGVGKSMADKMATILRADGLPTGPRT